MSDLTTHENEPTLERASDALDAKLVDAMTPGFEAECDPHEADRAGAFVEDALSVTDASESALDGEIGTGETATPHAENVVVGAFGVRDMSGKREA